MSKDMWLDAVSAVDELFPNVDTESAEYQYYDTLNRISAEIVNYRISHNLTQAALAKQLDVSQAMVSKYERGDYNFTLKALWELCDKLGMRFSCDISSANEEYSCIYSTAEINAYPEGEPEAEIAC